MNRYVEISSKRDIEKSNEWYQTCKSKNIPFIRIERKIRYSTVEYDYYTSKLELESLRGKFTAELHSEVLKIFEKYKNKKSKHFIDMIIRFENLEFENARLAADDLYDLIFQSFNPKGA